MAKATATQLVKTIVEGIREKKGKNILSLDFKKIDNAICRYFVVCEGDSSTHVDAIADSVEEYVRINAGEKPWGSAGYENAEWIFLDYGDVIVHVFQPHIREFYKLEELWADCVKKEYPNEE
ncbi:MAG: ribosome silencing factor [Bacteroidales bacterium]|nr:ribosome silencing factor [Bacteroidales bacterium]